MAMVAGAVVAAGVMVVAAVSAEVDDFRFFDFLDDAAVVPEATFEGGASAAARAADVFRFFFAVAAVPDADATSTGGAGGAS